MADDGSLIGTRSVLLLQHAGIRGLIDDCRRGLEAASDTDGPAAHRLAASVTALERAFAEHNLSEEAALPDLLSAHGGARVEQMVREHAQEHGELRAVLVDADPAHLLEALASLEDHLDTEERLFLNARLPPAR